MPKHQEISRFTTNGKTFFFNRGVARNDSAYLAINALYGRGNQERLVLFQPHMIEFWKHYAEAMEQITGLKPGEKKFIETCPDCGSLPADWRVRETPDGTLWYVACSKCRQLIFENVDGAHREVEEKD